MNNKGCGYALVEGQWWKFCGETDMGQTAPALCTQCGGSFKRAEPQHVYETELARKLAEHSLIGHNETGVALPSEATHWYHRDGRPCYQVEAKNGTMRPTTLADARKLNLVPSVTTILGAADKPGLRKWKLQQMLLAALTLPRLADESIEDFAERVISDSEEQSKKAMERGTSLHEAIETFIQDKPVPLAWTIPHVVRVKEVLTQYGIDITTGKAEHSFASPLGYGGKLDWHNDEILIDFKTKDRIMKSRQLAWPEHCWQLAAYRTGLFKDDHPLPYEKTRRLINVFIGVDDCQVRIHEWTPQDAEQGWKAFKCLLDFWMITKNFK